MATADRYSRLVLWLKVALPLAALAILSTLFFVAETLDPEAAIPYAKVDVARILEEQGATSPNFGSVTTDGIAISLSASAIRPGVDDRNKWTGTELSAELSMPSGAQVTIRSPEGIVDATNEQAILGGGAVLETSTGYRVTTETITTFLEDARVVASGGIVAVGPAGRITAGKMTLTRMDSGEPSHHLVFQDRVRLVYQPPS